MPKLPKKGTMWLISRLREGHTLTKEEAEEVINYVGELETSNDNAYATLRNIVIAALDEALDQDAFRKLRNSIDDSLPVAYDKRPKEAKTWEIMCDSDGCHRDIRLHRNLDLELAEIAFYNKIATGEVIRRACEFVANYPGAVGLTSIPPQKPSVEDDPCSD